MAEVMAKSKEHKVHIFSSLPQFLRDIRLMIRIILQLLRQMEREQGENLRHQLDQDFDSLRSLIYAPDASATASNATPLGRIRSENDVMIVQPGSTTIVPPPLGEGVDYDTHVRELAFDKRAQPKDRIKTEEELARAEKEALETAERRRRRRMLGENDDTDDEDDPGRGRKGREGKKT